MPSHTYMYMYTCIRSHVHMYMCILMYVHQYTVNQEIHAAFKSCGFTLGMIPRKSNMIYTYMYMYMYVLHVQLYNSTYDKKIPCDFKLCTEDTLHEYARIRYTCIYNITHHKNSLHSTAYCKSRNLCHINFLIYSTL